MQVSWQLAYFWIKSFDQAFRPTPRIFWIASFPVLSCKRVRGLWFVTFSMFNTDRDLWQALSKCDVPRLRVHSSPGKRVLVVLKHFLFEKKVFTWIAVITTRILAILQTLLFNGEEVAWLIRVNATRTGCCVFWCRNLTCGRHNNPAACFFNRATLWEWIRYRLTY